jgi:glycosyltransferase involved in cell wall biosynthesis
MDSDLEHPPSLIPELLARFEQGYDIVQTRRIYPADVSPLKKASSRAFYRLVSHISSVPISESAADFRLCTRKVLRVFQTQIREQHQFLRGLFPWVGFNTATVEFTSTRRAKGRSKYTLSRMLAFALVGIISFSKTPLKLSIYIGLAMSILAIIHGIVMTVLYFVTSKPPQGWTTLIALISFLGGVQLIVLGIIGEYVGAIFDEVKGRPLYIVDEVFGYPRQE